jgi:transcription-repair coupling factor (superfamily II helicase)
MAIETAATGSGGLLGKLIGNELRGSLAKFQTLLAQGAASRHPAVVSGLHGASASLLMAAWYYQARQQALVIAPTREAAQQLADDLETWLGPDAVVYLPQQEVLAYDRKSPDPLLVGALLQGLDLIRQGQPRLLVTSLYGLRQRILPPAHLA